MAKVWFPDRFTFGVVQEPLDDLQNIDSRIGTDDHPCPALGVMIPKPEEMNQFGDTNAFFKLLNSVEGAVFYIENQETETLEAQFNLKMENFMI